MKQRAFDKAILDYTFLHATRRRANRPPTVPLPVKTNVRQIQGPWSLGYTLDKHTISSTYIGDDNYGHAIFDTKRTEVGESLYQLKYKSDHSQATVLAEQIVHSLWHFFPGTSFVLPMPPSKPRALQPVTAIARAVGAKTGVRCLEHLLLKNTATAQIKDIGARDDRATALSSAFRVADVLPDGMHDVLLIDDLYDTGSSLEAATRTLQQYPKIRRVFVTAVTRKHL